jgi:hypothetical protein
VLIETVPNNEDSDDEEDQDVGTAVGVQQVGVPDQEDIQAEEMFPAAMDAKYGPRTGKYDLRERKPRSYGHLHTVSHKDEPEAAVEKNSMATPQMSMKQGIKAFKQDAVDAVGIEIKQLHDRTVIAPKHAKELTHEQKKEARAYLMFLKHKPPVKSRHVDAQMVENSVNTLIQMMQRRPP